MMTAPAPFGAFWSESLGVSPRIRKVVQIAAVAALVGLSALALHDLFGLGSSRLDWIFNDFLYNALQLLAAAACLTRAALVRAERAAWLVLGLGLVSYFLGDLYYTLFLADLDSPPFPSPADALYLLFYPACYVALALLAHSRVRRFKASVCLDGVIGALAIAGAVAALTLPPVLRVTEGNTSTVVTNLAYPLGDILLIGLVVVVLGLSGWRPGRAWLMIAAGLATTAIADSIYLYQAANDTYVEGTLLDALWPAGTLLIAFAAWQPTPVSRMNVSGRRVLAIPALFALTALALLVYDHFAPLTPLALLLLTLALVAAIVRMAAAFGDNLKMLARSQREALTDSLTGLGNRRQLMRDLEDAFNLAWVAEPRALVLFDLDGFKTYNDTYGHPAGDELLMRIGRSLADAVARRGTVYRMGGDEFCVLLRASAGLDKLIAAGAAAMAESGKGFDISSSYGSVVFPHEAGSAVQALQLADRRMYERKQERSDSATSQTAGVLMRVLQEREPDLHEHLNGVGELAAAVGRRLDLSPERLDELVRAAELHDVGKMAIPDAILNKPGKLSESEWEFMRRHTVIGERILSAAPALAPVAKVVRSSHERWDGDGYPDGLKGEEIPIGARIIAACDTFDAMTSDRPYRRALTVETALAELRRCAKTQFDPRVVRAFCDELNERLLREEREAIRSAP